MRFCPRIGSLHRQRIYCADPARDFRGRRVRQDLSLHGSLCPTDFLITHKFQSKLAAG